MSQVRSDLVYDVGLFDGGDTAYYLFRGYNVVAVDANPVMVEKARTQFAKEIKEKADLAECRHLQSSRHGKLLGFRSR